MASCVQPVVDKTMKGQLRVQFPTWNTSFNQPNSALRRRRNFDIARRSTPPSSSSLLLSSSLVLNDEIDDGPDVLAMKCRHIAIVRDVIRLLCNVGCAYHVVSLLYIADGTSYYQQFRGATLCRFLSNSDGMYYHQYLEGTLVVRPTVRGETLCCLLRGTLSDLRPTHQTRFDYSARKQEIQNRPPNSTPLPGLRPSSIAYNQQPSLSFSLPCLGFLALDFPSTRRE